MKMQTTEPDVVEYRDDLETRLTLKRVGGDVLLRGYYGDDEQEDDFHFEMEVPLGNLVGDLMTFVSDRTMEAEITPTATPQEVREQVLTAYRQAAEQMRKANEFHKYVERSIAMAEEATK